MSNGSRAKDRTSAERENDRQAALQKWLTEIAGAKIKAVLEDAALPFIEQDASDDQQLGSFDCTGDFDPIIPVGTDSRLLSEEIKRAAATFRIPEKKLQHLLDTRLREEWNAKPKKIPNEPQGKSYGRSYLVSRHGVWLRQVVAELDDLTVWRRIAKTRIDPEALSYDTTPQRNCQHRYLVTAGEIGQFPVDIPAEHLGEKATRAINTLMRHGVHIVESREARQQLAKFLRIRPDKRIIRAPRTGWLKRSGRWVVVLPNETLGATEDMHIVLDGGTTRPGDYGFHCSGTSDEWREHVAGPLARQSNVILAVGTYFAAPLLKFAEQSGGGFHSSGTSKIGKSLAWAIGQSVWGKPYFPGVDASTGTFGFDWNSTSGRLEERAVLRTDVGIYLDETHVGDRKAIANAIYTLAGSLGRGRKGQREVTFNLLIGSTGEKSIVDFLKDVTAGQTVRLTDVPAEVQPGSAFEVYDPVAAAEFYSVVSKYHGSIGRDWLQYLVDQTPEKFTPRLKELCAIFIAQPSVAEIVAHAHPQVRSVINRFALVAAALAMAIEAGILPWTQTDTDAGIIACMQRWLNQRGNRDASGELIREIDRRLHGFADIVGDRLIHLVVDGRRLVAASPVEQHKLKTGRFYGFTKNGRILLTHNGWQRFCASLDDEAVKKVLWNRQILMPGHGGKDTRVEKVPRGDGSTSTDRFYVLASTFIDLKTV